MARPFGTYFGVDTLDNIEDRVRNTVLQIVPIGTCSTDLHDGLEEVGIRGRRWRETDQGQMAYEMTDREQGYIIWRCFETTADEKLIVQYDLRFNLKPTYRRGKLYGHQVGGITVSVRTIPGGDDSRPGDLLRAYFNIPDDVPVDEKTIRDAILNIFPLGTSDYYITQFIRSLQIKRDEYTSVAWLDQCCLLKLCDPLMPGEFFHLKFTFGKSNELSRRDLFGGISVQRRKPIMSLTAQQEAQATEYGRQWRAIVLRTSTIDRESTANTVKQFYRKWSQPPPEVVFCESPFQLIVLPVLLRRFSRSQNNMEETRKGLKARFEPVFGPEPWAQMEASLWQSLAVAMHRGVHQLLRPIDFVGFPVPRDQGYTTHGALAAKLRVQLNKFLDRFILQIDKEMHRTTVEQLIGLSTPPHAALANQLARALSLQGLAETGLDADRWLGWWGPWRAQELNSVRCFQEMFGSHSFSKQMNQQLEVWSDLQKSALIYSFFKNVCFACDFPAEIHTDARVDMHNADRPAIVFRDSHSAYAWHGVAVPRYVIEEPDRITIRDIESEPNVERRRVKMTRYGEAKYLQDTHTEIIDASEFGNLYRKEVLNDEPLVMVQVVNSTPEPDGTRKTYFLRVPPDMRTAREAVAWTFGVPADDYDPSAES